MTLTNKLIAFVLRQVIGDAADGVAAVESWVTNHGQTLLKALERANDRAWAAFGVALAGESLFDKGKLLVASGDSKGVVAQIRRFLKSNAASFAGTPPEFRQNCLNELKHLRKSGRLSIHGLSIGALACYAGSFQCYGDSNGMIEAASQAVAQMGEELERDYPNLAGLLRTPLPKGPPLLVAAFMFFFRREVETDSELAHGLFFDGVRQLAASQEKGFAALKDAFGTVDEQFDFVFQGIGEIVSRVGVIQDTTEATRAAVLDVHGELRRLIQQGKAGDAKISSLLEAVRDRLERAGMQKGEVRPQHSFSIGSEGERRAVKALLERFRQLPPAQQNQVPALLNGLGKLQVGIGDLDGARESFSKVVQVLDGTAPGAEAEAHYNAYRTALEQKKWDEALAEIQKAASLDRERFEPFPLRRYQPQRILGAGGAGTAFLCHDAADPKDVVVKALHSADMELDIEEVFSEAKVLRQLEHPAIIRIWHWDFADWHRHARPYLVMEHFPGCTLEEYVQQHGKLAPRELLPLAKQLVEGMQAAHGRGILHRDLKPSNVLVRKDGDQWQVIIIDFGLAARQCIDTNISQISAGTTRSQSIIGTLRYAPPEQLGRLPGVESGVYSDVYAFGKLCCFALFLTTDLKSRHWNSIPKGLVDFLGACIEEELTNRCPNFDRVMSWLEPDTKGIINLLRDLSIDEEIKYLERDVALLNRNLWEITCPVCGETQDTECSRFWCESCAVPVDFYGSDMAEPYEDTAEWVRVDFDQIDEDNYTDEIACPACRKKVEGCLLPYKVHECPHCGKSFNFNIEWQFIDEKWIIDEWISIDWQLIDEKWILKHKDD